MNTASDDPASAAEILGTDRRIRALDQFRRNMDSASGRFGAAEDVINQLTDLLSRAREIATAQSGDTADSATRRTAAAEVDQILQTVIQLANTRFGGAYLFGGAHADTAPLAEDGSVSATHPPVGESPVALDQGQTVLTVHDAQNLFVDSGIIASLQRLASGLQANDISGIRGGLADVGAAFDVTQNRLGELGARANRMEAARENIETLMASAEVHRSNLADADFDQAMIELFNRQTAYDAALMATSRILRTTLTDYLR